MCIRDSYYAVRDLLTYYDAEQTAFSIINQYVRFVDEEPDKRKNDWKLNERWAWFIGCLLYTSSGLSAYNLQEHG